MQCTGIDKKPGVPDAGIAHLRTVSLKGHAGIGASAARSQASLSDNALVPTKWKPGRDLQVLRRVEIVPPSKNSGRSLKGLCVSNV